MNHDVDRVHLVGESCRRTFAERVESGTSPGAGWAVFVGGTVIAAGGAGVVTPGGTPVTADTAFRIASCTKSFTAAMALRLRDRGLLDLDAPIDRHLDLGPSSGHDDRIPTVAQLLSMAGGLPGDDPWADRQESLGRDEFRTLLSAGVRFARPPGVSFEYSNLGFAMVGAAIERVTGRDFTELVTADLLRAGGFGGIGFDSAVADVDGVAIGHRRLDGTWLALPFSDPGAFSPIGGVFASASALARWAGWLVTAGTDEGLQEDDAEQILSAASRRDMQQPHTATGAAGRDYALGLVTEDGRHGRIVSHSGGYPGFGSHMRWHAATGIGIVGLENARYSGAVTAVTTLLDAVLDALVVPDAVPTLWPETIAARLSLESLLRQWDPVVADALFSDNVDLDEPLPRRVAEIGRLADAVGLAGSAPVTLEHASPRSTSPANLSWTSPGRTGLLRCAISLTPQSPPRVQTLSVHQV
ncbi:serine hydrolase domain-containing protein [Nakamurella sp. A5-74]|uniref:Serine hydrolase domain-containing protein n=1 Tax=Nakamurella sp. A5-74 TaxID=3158264 RepID=A0AAU8DNT9_9ACTN